MLCPAVYHGFTSAQLSFKIYKVKINKRDDASVYTMVIAPKLIFLVSKADDKVNHLNKTPKK